MATEKVEVNKTTCDGCGKEVYHSIENSEPVLGFHGTVVWHHSAGAAGCKWFANTERCIGNAVKNALSRRMEEPNGHPR